MLLHLVQGWLRIIRRVDLVSRRSRNGSDLLVTIGGTVERSDWSQNSLLFDLAANRRT